MKLTIAPALLIIALSSAFASAGESTADSPDDQLLDQRVCRTVVDAYFAPWDEAAIKEGGPVLSPTYLKDRKEYSDMLIGMCGILTEQGKNVGDFKKAIRDSWPRC